MTQVADAEPLGAFRYDENNTIVGFLQTHTVQKGETLLDIAVQYDIGFNQIVLANPGVDPWIPEAGQKISIPGKWILPHERGPGIVINLAEMRLYYFFQSLGGKYVRTFPIGVGREGMDTPLGIFYVIDKKKNPPWYVPESIRKEEPELPSVVPPGPDNPLGSRALYISGGNYRIHGTNKAHGIGRRVSHGCLRLYPWDIETLYELTDIGESVVIIYEPIKVGTEKGNIFIQVFSDYSNGNDEAIEESLVKLRNSDMKNRIDFHKVEKAVKEKNGLPSDITITGEKGAH